MWTQTASSAVPPAREAACLDRLEERARWWIAVGAIALVVGIFVWMSSCSGTPRLLGGLATFCGAGFVISGPGNLRLLKLARQSLRFPPRDFLFERKFQLTRGGNSWPASLRSRESQQLIASFGWNQWSVPFSMVGEQMSARVYGDPTRRSIVVVSCADGVLAGRISLSRFSDGASTKRPASPVTRWLLTPLRMPRKR
jgi:hypothetical protein